MSEPDADTYALKSAALAEVAAPALPYQPPLPRAYRPRIGVIGAGGIVSAHLDAYRTAGWEVAAICNRTRAKAEAKAAEFAPRARVTDRWEEVLADPAIDVVDITPHPADRLPIIEAALRAGKHVLSQKPFVLDLAEGRRLVALARENGYALNVSSKRFQLAPKPKPLATGGIVRPGIVTTTLDPTEHLVTMRPAQRDLIAEGKVSKIGKVRKAAERYLLRDDIDALFAGDAS